MKDELILLHVWLGLSQGIQRVLPSAVRMLRIRVTSYDMSYDHCNTKVFSEFTELVLNDCNICHC